MSIKLLWWFPFCSPCWQFLCSLFLVIDIARGLPTLLIFAQNPILVLMFSTTFLHSLSQTFTHFFPCTFICFYFHVLFLASWAGSLGHWYSVSLIFWYMTFSGSYEVPSDNYFCALQQLQHVVFSLFSSKYYLISFVVSSSTEVTESVLFRWQLISKRLEKLPLRHWAAIPPWQGARTARLQSFHRCEHLLCDWESGHFGKHSVCFW